MAEDKENIEESQIEYGSEELEVIESLLSFFNKAPGQIDIPDEVDEDDLSEEDVEIGAPISSSDTEDDSGPPSASQYEDLPDIPDIEDDVDSGVSDEYKDYSDLENIPMEEDPPPPDPGPVNETLAGEDLGLPDDGIDLDFGAEENTESPEEATESQEISEDDIPDFNDLNIEQKNDDFNGIPNGSIEAEPDPEPVEDPTPEIYEEPEDENISEAPPSEETPSDAFDSLDGTFDSGDTDSIDTGSMGDLGDLGGLSDMNGDPDMGTPDAGLDMSGDPDMGAPDDGLDMNAPDDGLDMGTDGGLDMGAPDGGLDMGTDGGLDMDAPDGGLDMGTDGGLDMGTDGGLDMGTPDGGLDMGTDGGLDMGTPDGDLGMGTDGGLDMPDGGLDMGTPDGGLGMGTDGGLDMPDGALDMDAPDDGLDMPDAGLAPMDTVDSFSDPISTDLKPPSLSELSPQTALEEAQKTVDPYAEDEDSDIAGFIPGDETADDFSMPDKLVTPKEEIKPKAGEISDQELKALRERLKEYPKELRKRIIGTIVEDKISEKAARDLVLEIIAGEPHQRIEEELNKKVGDYFPELKDKNREPRTVVTRPAYTESGRRRQAQLMHYTRIGALAALAFIVLSSGLYYTVLKPYLYHSLIDEGKELIIIHGCRGKNHLEAEKLFKESLEYYPARLDAYLQYGDTYKRKGCYQLAFEKLYGDLLIPSGEKALRWNDMEIVSGKEIWKNSKKTPVLRWQNQKNKVVLIDSIPFLLKNHGAYTLTHLQKKRDHSRVLLALGNFHTNPANRFRNSDYKNNLLGIDYYQRILSFHPETPMFSKEEYISQAVRGIGNVYYHKKDYYKSLEYFEKIIKNDPYDIEGQSGVLNNLIKIYHKTNDPRLVLQQHSLIKHRLKIEKKLPIYILAKLASFYIDLPVSNDLRIKYNVSPVDPVNGVHLRERALELLNILFSKKEEDIYGNEILGKKSAEGFYQRGRYYRYVMQKPRMALKQMEYAYRYNPGHFLSLNERAELLMELYDYQGAIEHLELAMKYITDETMNTLGDRPEDETLIESDRAEIPFNLGKALYLSLVKDLSSSSAWFRLKELEKYQSKTHSGIKGLSGVLEKSNEYFNTSEKMGLHEEKKLIELHYFRGWSYYIQGDYKAALADWEGIDPKWQIHYKNVSLARAHALYQLSLEDQNMRKDYLENALGELLYLEEKYAREAEMVKSPVPGNKSHIALFTRLAIIENNMGAIYEVLKNEKKSLEHYWKSIDYSKQISKENEIAHLNIQLNFKRAGLEEKEQYPVIMDYIAPSISDKSF